MNTRFLRASLILLGCSTALSPPVRAADMAPTGRAGVEEVIVTARRREENIQTTPVAVTAISAATLEKRDGFNLEQIARFTPALNVLQTPGTLGTATLYMRGIGYSDSEIGQDSPVGVYLDGVPFSRVSTALMQLVAPDQVEVLRGPQGTLFGRNTTGGAIVIRTHTSGDDFGGMVKTSYGRFDTKTVQTRIDSGLLGNSGIKFTISYARRQQDGDVQSGTLPKYLDPNAQTSDTYFAKINGNWGDFTAALAADYSDMSGVPPELQVIAATPAVQNFISSSTSHGGCGGYPITTTPLYNLPCDSSDGQQHMVAYGTSLTLNYHFSDAISVKSITSIRDYKRDPDPASYGPVVMGNIGTAAAPNITTFNGLFNIFSRTQSTHQVTQEGQLLGTVGDFDYVAGIFYFGEVGGSSSSFQLPFALGNGATALNIVSPRGYTIDDTSIAGFAQANYRPSFLDKKLELSGGIRWTKDTRDTVQSQPVVRSSDLGSKNTSFLVSASYQWTSDLMTFIRYSTGYRAGGYNSRAVAGADPIYTPEYLKSLEAGFKFEFFDKQLRLNGSAYYNKYRGLQVAQFIVPGTGTGAAGGVNQINANARFQGFELELDAVPVDRLTLSASVSYIDPKYSSFPQALSGTSVLPGCSPISSGGATVGQDCAAIAAFDHFPKTQADFNVSYALPEESYGEWSAQMSYSYKGAMKFEALNTAANPYQAISASKPYGLLSARLALSHIPISKDVKGQIAIVGENLTDKVYNEEGIDFGSFATAIWGQRRSFMVEGTVEF